MSRRRAPAAIALVAVVGTWLIPAVLAAGPAGPAAVTTPAERLTADWPRRVRVVATGDILPETALTDAAAIAAADSGGRFDFAELFATDGLIAWADLAICHVETPIGRPGGPWGWSGRSPYGGNLILGPYELAPGLAAASFDRCSTASNHAYDLGADGVASTLEALDSVGISHAGTARSGGEAQSEVFDIEGVGVAHLSYTRSSNTVRPPHDWALTFADSPADVIADVDAVRAAGAELVIVSLHVSPEMQSAPSAADRAFTEAVLAGADIDLIVHHGPHVVQPLERIDGVPVFWSVGNFVSGMGMPYSGRYADQRTLDGLLASVTFTEQPDGSFVADAQPVAICTDRVTRRVRHAVAAMTDPTTSGDERSRAASCLTRTRAVVPDAR